MISSLIAFSQKGTDTLPVKQFSIPVVKMIVKDLLSGDSAKQELKLANQQLDEMKKLVSLKDSVIVKLEQKDLNSEKIIGLCGDKFTTLETHTKQVEKELKKEKIKTKIFKTLSFIGTALIAAFLITN
jgi:hypothetical protein